MIAAHIQTNMVSGRLNVSNQSTLSLNQSNIFYQCWCAEYSNVRNVPTVFSLWHEGHQRPQEGKGLAHEPVSKSDEGGVTLSNNMDFPTFTRVPEPSSNFFPGRGFLLIRQIDVV
jgi:hypothetical protein